MTRHHPNMYHTFNRKESMLKAQKMYKQLIPQLEKKGLGNEVMRYKQQQIKLDKKIKEAFGTTR